MGVGFPQEHPMSVNLAALFDDFDRGRLSRRQLLKALGVAVAIRPASAFAQGQCGGARAGTPECGPTPAKLPFQPPRRKIVLLDPVSRHGGGYPHAGASSARAPTWYTTSCDRQ